MRLLWYFICIMLVLISSQFANGQLLGEKLTNGNWAPSIPIEVLRTSDTVVLKQEAGIPYGHLEFLNDSSMMICQSQHYCKRMKNGSYSSGTDYRWYGFGRWYTKGDTMEIIRDNIIYVCEKFSGTSANLKFIVLKRTVQYPK